MLLEAGFKVVSCDASDKMLKQALEERWRRRKEPAFDQWGKLTTVTAGWYGILPFYRQQHNIENSKC